MKMGGIVAFLGCFTSQTMAAESIVYRDSVNDCFAQGIAQTSLPDCIGAASNACQRLHTDGFDGGTTQGIAICLAAETKVWQDLLDEVVEQSWDILEERDQQSFVQNMDRTETYAIAQKTWDDFRQAECRLAYALNQEGTMRVIRLAACELRRPAARTLNLYKKMENR